MKTDVVIPARNEEKTIAWVVNALRCHPSIGRIIVVIDAETTDNTASEAWVYYATNVCRHDHISGKGQLVKHGLTHVETSRVLFCDADITGLTHDHITTLVDVSTWRHRDDTMIIGIPDFPKWDEVPPRFRDTLYWAWPWVSGERSMLTDIARSVNLHGYLMETQLNNANHAAGKKVRLERLHGLKSPVDLNERRLQEMDRDRQWGLKNGVLPQ